MATVAAAVLFKDWGGDFDVMVILGACKVTFNAESHNGDMKLFLTSLLRGCNRSGDRALRSRGDLGSEFFGRPNAFFDVVVGVHTIEEPEVDGLYDCVVFELPGG